MRVTADLNDVEYLAFWLIVDGNLDPIIAEKMEYSTVLPVQRLRRQIREKFRAFERERAKPRKRPRKR